ncbi:hypothetical protein [Enterococcus faecalis]|uniref:hypothetical protein n=1 Tax=Enterococcus faecalis TaxID=1351 RepID=UPI0040432D43
MDWKKIGKKAFDISKQATEKGIDSFQDWKNDPERIEQNKLKKVIKNYIPIESSNLIFNEITKEWSIKKNKKEIYSQDDLLSFEYLENDTSVTKGGASLGRAAVGGLLLGGAGLVLGGVTGKKKTNNEVSSMKLVITIKNKKNRIEAKTISYSFGTIDRSGSAYQKFLESAKSDIAILNIVSQGELN